MIGQRIRIERQKQNLLLKTLALEIGITPSELSQIETGKRQLTVKLLLKIADILHITPNDILGKNISIKTSETEYTIYLSKEDLKIIKEIQKHEKLYKMLSSDRGKENIEMWSNRLS